MEAREVLLSQILPLAFAVVRILPLVWLIPVFGVSPSRAFVRAGFALMLALLSFPRLAGAVLPIGSPLLLLLLGARELAVGLTLGIVVSFVFRTVEMAGRLIDTVRGANLSEVQSPTTGKRTSPFGLLYTLLTVVIFLEVGGLGHLLVAVGRSYEAVPLWPLTFPDHAHGLAMFLVMASARMIEAAIGLAAPVLVALLLADLALGLVARSAAQVPVYFLGLPLKALGGVGIVLLSFGTVRLAIEGQLGESFRLLERSLEFWR